MFDTLHPLEITLIKNLQMIRDPILDGIMIALNYVDTMPFYVLLILCVWFFYNQKQGIRMLYLLLISAFVNQECKELFAQPRPCQLYPELALLTARSFGFPSGAAQSMVVLFGFLSVMLKKRAFWIFSIFFTLLISFSRVYLGLHFFSDIVGGWILGLFILTSYLCALPSIERFLAHSSKLKLHIVCIVIFVILWFLSLNHRTSFAVVSGFGLSLGLLWGSLLEETLSCLRKISRFIIALVGLAALLSAKVFLHSPLISGICDFLAGFWVGFLASFLFGKIESSWLKKR